MAEQSALTSSELKGERVKPVTRKELALVIGLCVVLAAGANSAARWAVDTFAPNLGFRVYQTKWKQLLALSEPVDWLVLGDSSANQGVDPEFLERYLGGRAINLATIADASAVVEAWMLEQYIARFGPPRGVVLIHVYDMWQRPIQYQLLAETPLPWGYWNTMEPRVDMNFRQTMQVAEFRYLPLYARQDSLLLLLHGKTDFDERPVITDGGFMKVTRANPRSVATDVQEHLAFTRDNTFTMAEENQRALDTIAALADRYNFDLFLANAPLYSGVYDNQSFRAYYRQVVDALTTRFAGNRHFHYLFQQPMLFSIDVMRNVDHLTTAGARRYSEELARRLETLVPPNDEGRLLPGHGVDPARPSAAQVGTGGRDSSSRPVP